MNLIGLKGHGPVEGNGWKGWKGGYLEKEGTLKNMEPGEVGVREMVLHGHSLVCQDAKRDLLYTRRHTRSCQCGKRGEVGLRQKGITWKSRSKAKTTRFHASTWLSLHQIQVV